MKLRHILDALRLDLTSGYTENWFEYPFKSWSDRGTLTYDQLLDMQVDTFFTDPRFINYNPWEAVPRKHKKIIAKVLYNYGGEKVTFEALKNQFGLLNPEDTPRILQKVPSHYKTVLDQFLINQWPNPAAGCSNAADVNPQLSHENLSSSGGSPIDYNTYFSYPQSPSDFTLQSHLSLPAPDSPLDQFEIFPLLTMKIGDFFFFSFTNSSLFMLLTLGLVLLMILLVTKKGGGKLVPNAWQSVVELIYDFVLNLVNEQIGGPSANVKQKFFPCILVTFTFLLFCNLQGMIPFSFTVTSHFLITLALSFSLFIGITIVGFQRHGLHFFSFLLPAGVPLPLAPFLVLLELISHCFRALSSGIRLFANMMAGHSLVKILSGFAWTMLFMNNIFYFIGDLGPLFIVLALTGLELGVAILQAYVFTILICIYLNDAINLH